MVFKLSHVLNDVRYAGVEVEVGYIRVEMDVDLFESGPGYLTVVDTAFASRGAGLELRRPCLGATELLRAWRGSSADVELKWSLSVVQLSRQAVKLATCVQKRRWICGNSSEAVNKRCFLRESIVDDETEKLIWKAENASLLHIRSLLSCEHSDSVTVIRSKREVEVILMALE